MIEFTRTALAQNDWLTPETRDKAIVKLNVIKPYIGYQTSFERYSQRLWTKIGAL